MNTTHAYMLNRYMHHAYTHRYIIGVQVGGLVYGCYHTDSILPTITTMSRASRGKGSSIRFKPNKKQKELIIRSALATFTLCTVEELEEEATKHGKQINRGVAFEALVHRYYGQEYKKDNKDFASAPDIVIDNIGYQIKYEQATICTASQIDRLP